MICGQCRAEGKTSRVSVGLTSSTMAYYPPYYDEEGRYHHHDLNASTTSYSCSNGHKWGAPSPRSCPTCGPLEEEDGMKRATPPRIRSVLVSATGMVAVFDERGKQMAEFQGYARNPEDFDRLERLAAACDSATAIEPYPGGRLSIAEFRSRLAREKRKSME